MSTKELLKKENFRRAVLVALGMIFYFLLLICYHNLIVPVFSYTGINYSKFSFVTWVVSLLFSLVPLIWMPIRFTRPSDFASWILYLCLIFPSNIFVFMISNLPPSESVVLPIALNASFIVFEYVRRKRLMFALPALKTSPTVFKYFLPFVTIILSLGAMVQRNFEFTLSFSDIYVRRMEARSILTDAGLASYLEVLLSSVCVPIGIIYGLETRKWRFVAVAFFAVLVIFSLKGSKGLLFSPLVFLTIYFFASRNRRYLGFIMLGLFILIVALSLIEAFVAHSSIIALYVVRRKLVVPTQLTTYYWDFFSHNPFEMMKDSVFGWLIPGGSNYSIPRARLIGYEYFSDIDINANANLWAAGFADFGYFGMVITAILAGFTLQIIDKLSAKGGRFVIASVLCVFIGLVWSETAFYTSFLSNGVLFLILALWVYPYQYNS